MHSRNFALPLLVATALAISTAHTSILVDYDFDNFTAGTNVTTAYPAFATGAYVNSFAIQAASSYIDSSYENPWDGNGVRGVIRRRPVPAPGVYIRDLDDALTYGAYFSLTFTPEEETSFSSITFDSAVSWNALEEPLPVGITLRSSLTGTQNLGDWVVGSVMTIGERETVLFDLSSFSALQNVSTPVTFYFYMDNQGEPDGRDFFIDNLTLQAVPEPSAMALVALGATTLLLSSRRRRSSPSGN